VASADDSTTVELPNYNLSILYKTTDNSSVYATYNYSENPGGAIANGGGFGQLEDPDGDGVYTISENRLTQESELLEAGAKASFMENTLFLGAAVFQQTRSNLQLDGSIVEFETKGFELEANYQPNRKFFMTFGYSYTDAKTNEPQFDVNNTDPWLPDQLPFFLLSGEQPVQGVPRHLLNAVASYKITPDLTLTVGGFAHSKIRNNSGGSLIIPWQFNIDTTLAYTWDDWEFRLSALNTTDEENWSAPNAVYGGESIVAELPLRLEFTAKLNF